MEERQKALYKFLVANSDEWISQSEIARELYEYYGNGECCLEPQNYHNSTERLLLLKDLQELRVKPEFEKLVISSSKGVKIANEEEHQQYIVRQYRSILKKLKRICIMEKKGNANGQITIDGHTIEAYLHGVDAEIGNF